MFTIKQQLQTYLQMVRTDQSQISQLLDTTFNQINVEVQLLSNNFETEISNKFKLYVEQCKVFLFGQIHHEMAEKEFIQNFSKRGVCAKSLSAGDIAWKCETCQKDSTCIICQECFEKSNHKGHKIRLQRNVSGCCDCGDPDAWQEEGFCSDHKGYQSSGEALLQQLPSHIKASASYVFSSIAKHLKYCFLNSLKQYTIKDVLKQGSSCAKYYQLIEEVFHFLDRMIEISPVFIHYIADAFNLIFFTEIQSVSNHTCCIRTFINKEDEEQYQIQFNQSQQSTLQNQACSCTVLDLTFQLQQNLNDSTKEFLYEFFFKMFQSFKFKQMIGLSYIANLETISKQRQTKNNNIGQVGVQILTIDEVALMIVKNDLLRQNLVDVFGKQIDEIVSTECGTDEINDFIRLLYDIKYMAKTETLKYVLYETDFIESLFSHMPKLYYLDAIEQRIQHVSFDQSLFKQQLIEIEIQFIKTFKCYLKEIDYTNLNRNKKLIIAFASFFKEINIEFNKHELKGFFIIPLHRMFSYYFNRLLLKNFVIKQESKEVTIKRSSQILADIFKQFIDSPPQYNKNDFIQETLNHIIRPLCRAWTFIHEMISGKWVTSGMLVNQYPNFYYHITEYYLLLDLNLFQLIICVSNESQQIIQQILNNQSIDKSLNLLYQQLENNIIVEKEYEKFKPLFDIRKLKTHLQWSLRLLIQLAVVEISYLYPLKGNNSAIHYQYDEQIKQIINQWFKNETKREIVHNLIKNGGRSDIKTIKSSSISVYTESESFDQALLEVATQHKDPKGKISFKLNDELFLQWFDPFYYLQPENQSKISEVLQQSQSKISGIIGDYKGNYRYQTTINLTIRESLAKSKIINIIISLISIYIQKESKGSFKQDLVDEQIFNQCLKLLVFILQGAQHINFVFKTNLIEAIKQNENDLIQQLYKLIDKEGELQEIIRNILLMIYNLDQMEFITIAQKLGIKDQEEQKTEEIYQIPTSREKDTKKLQLKEEAKKRKEEIMKKFQTKRTSYIEKNIKDHEFKRQGSSMYQSSNDEEEIQCSLCQEILQKENFYQSPYGQFAYVTQSKLMYQSLMQTLTINKQNLKNQNFLSQKEEDEEEKTSINQQKALNIDISYLNQVSKTGGVYIQCKHFAHYKCLNDYLVINETDYRKHEYKKLLGLDINTFQCPLCKHISNALIPSTDLQQFFAQLNSDEQQSFLNNNVIQFFSKIFKAQEQSSNELLLVDIQKDPFKFLTSMKNFFIHRFQLIDIKGINNFLKHDQQQTGKCDYADLFNLLINFLQIIFINSDFNHENLDTHCLQEIDMLIQNIQTNKGQLLKQDLSTFGMSVLFYATIIFSYDIEKKYQYLMQIVQVIHSLFKVQVLLKLALIKHNGIIRGTQEEVQNMFTKDELLKLGEDLLLKEQIIQSQLPFLRKITAFILMIHSMHRHEHLEIRKNEEEFAYKLIHIIDDNQEFDKLLEFLQLNSDFNVSYVHQVNNQQEVKQLDQLLKKISQFNYYEDIQQFIIEISQNKKLIKLEIPDQLLLLTTYFTFNFIQLPQDFQSFVQEYYKQKCKNCNKQVKSNVVCLLCSDIACFVEECCSSLPEMRKHEGELTYHTRMNEGKTGLFISTSNGEIIMIEQDRSSGRPSPYRNKFGETYSQKSRKWENFYIDDVNGGKHILEELKKHYMNFTIANEIVKDRSMTDKVYRLRYL